MNGLGLLNNQKKFKDLSLLPGFNLADPPVKINDNLRLNNRITLDNENKDVIDEKIFIKFFGVVDNTKEGNAKTEKKKTRKNKQAIKGRRMNKDTKKEKK